MSTSTQLNVTKDWLLDESLAPEATGDPLAPLYEGSARGELVLPFCCNCRLPLDLEQQVCDGCGSFESDWRPTALTGTVHSATMMHRIEPGLLEITAPYPILDVELAGGHRLVMTTVESYSAVPQIGDSVTIAFRNLGGVAIPAAHIHQAPIDTEDRS